MKTESGQPHLSLEQKQKLYEILKQSSFIRQRKKNYVVTETESSIDSYCHERVYGASIYQPHQLIHRGGLRP